MTLQSYVVEENFRDLQGFSSRPPFFPSQQCGNVHEEAGEYLAEPKQARGVAAENFFLMRTTQLERGDDFNRAVVAHVKAVVAAHHHTINADEFNEVVK